MDLSETPISCFVCLQDAHQSSHVYSCFDSEKKVKTFLKYLRRFLKADKELKSLGSAVSDLKCCDECLSLVNRFSDFYHQYKCLELKLDWMVSNIESVMRLANKTHFKIVQAKSSANELDLNQRNGKELITSFREDLIRNCQLKLGRSLPRVSVRRDVSSLPALFEPVIFDSSNESLNVILNSVNTDCENAPESEFGTDMDDAVNGHHDNIDISRIVPEKIDEISNTKDVAHIDLSTEKDTVSCVSNSSFVQFSTSPCATDNVVRTPPPFCKTEPVNDDVVLTEKSINENIIPTVCSTNTQLSPKKYNLRRSNLSQDIKQQIHDEDNDDHMISRNSNMDSLSNTSNSSFSETSSESSSSDEDDLETKSNISSLSKISKLKKKHKAKYKPVKVYICKSGECKKYFKIKQLHDNHLKLHKKGKFPCTFCSKVESNLVLLSNHELKLHGKTEDQNSKYEKRLACPRCPFKAFFVSDYEAHFAFTYFVVGVEPSRRRVFEKCKICNRSVSKQVMNSHIKACHDTTKLGDQKFQRCRKAGCTAYFLKSWQLRYHNQLEHKTVKVQEPTPKSVNCDICHAPFPKYSSPRQHKQRHHKNQIKNNPIINSKSETTEKTKKQFNCIFCPSVQDNPTELAMHEAETHGHLSSGKSKKTNRCPRCPYEYSLIRAFVKHHLHIHQILLNPECNSACKLCSGGNVYKANSDRHFKNFHLIDEGMVAHKCDKCPVYFRKSLQLQMHTIKIHKQDHKCEMCEKCFKTRISLIQHLRKSHPGYDENPDLPLGCDFSGGCKKRFETQTELDHHQKYGHQRPGWSGPPKKHEMRFKCEKCEKRFSCHTNLETHLITVHGDRPFVCEECGKGFKSKTTLDLHSEFHKGSDEWKFQCAECGKKCATKQKLDVHSRTHTKEKPFICQLCGEKYAHKQNWSIHLKSKHGDEEGIEEMIGKQKKGNYMSRKGTKRGDCIIATK